MTAIAWAIVIAGLYIAQPRDRTHKDFHLNNRFDVALLFLAIGMLIWHSVR